MPDLSNTVLNDVLCYISSARDSITLENLIVNCNAFYSVEAVKEAKGIISRVCNVTPITRKASAGKTPTPANIRDIDACFQKIEEDGLEKPSFVAKGFSSFPPNGFEHIAPMLCSLHDQLAALRHEIVELKKNSERDVRTMNNVDMVLQDVAEVKALVQRQSAPQNDERVQGPTTDDTAATRTLLHSSQIAEPSEINEGNSSGSNNNDSTGNRWNTANTRPYPNARRRNGLFANPNRRQFNASRSDPIANNRSSEGHGSQNSIRSPRGQQRTTIAGTRTSDSAISGGTRIYDVYVGGCQPEATTEMISEYCSENGVTLKKCEALNSASSWVKSFKISVTSEDREKLLVGEFWPSGINVRKFFRGKARNEHQS